MLVSKTDLYNLYETIKKFDVYSINYGNFSVQTVGPVSTLEYMVESTFGFDKNLINHITEHIISLDNYIFRWRSILGDGNCFYRAIIFAFLENIIFERNIELLKEIMTEINTKFDENYPNTRNLHFVNREEILKINKLLILKVFYLIYELLDSNKNAEGVHRAYEILLKSFMFCKSFDLVNRLLIT